MSRDLSDAERSAIRANARGENVFCGTEADAETIARGACDRDAEWSEDAANEAVRIAQTAWNEVQS